MHDLENVLEGQKLNKARDQQCLSKSLFKNSVIGNNLKHSPLKMFNNIKSVGIFPDFMKEATVTTIPKKGSKLLLKNERGIFLVNSVRSILMRLIFNLKYPMFDNHMSDSNVGGRQKKSGMNHIWMMNLIIHDQHTSVKKKPIVIH